MERKFLVPANHVRRERPGQPQEVLIDSGHLFERHGVVSGEVIEIAQRVLESYVADVAIGLRDALHQTFRANDVFAEIH